MQKNSVKVLNSNIQPQEQEGKEILDPSRTSRVRFWGEVRMKAPVVVTNENRERDRERPLKQPHQQLGTLRSHTHFGFWCSQDESVQFKLRLRDSVRKWRVWVHEHQLFTQMGELITKLRRKYVYLAWKWVIYQRFFLWRLLSVGVFLSLNT